MRLFILAAWLLACGAAAAMTDAERDQLREAARAGTQRTQAPQGTGSLLYKLGNARDVQALDELIALHDVRLLRAFVEGWGPTRTTPEYEARVLKHFEDREVAAVLIEQLYDYRDPALFEALYRDAEALARLRAERRRSCSAVIAQYQPLQVVTHGAIGAASPAPRQGQAIQKQAIAPQAMTRGGYAFGGGVQRMGMIGNAMVGWSYVCERGAPDNMALDVDGRPLALDGRRNREAASVEAIARNEIAGTQTRLAPLFRDLSLYPLPDWKLVDAPADKRTFTTAHPPMAFLDLYKKRLYAPAPGPLLDVLKEVVPVDRDWGRAVGGPPRDGPETDRDTWWNIVSFHTALVPSDSPEATRALGASLERAAAIGRAQDRKDFLSRLAPLLGPVLPPAQIDLDALKKRILDRAPYEGVPELSRLFTQVEAENRSLREPSAASLTRWIDNTHWRRLVVYLLEHGVDPNQPVSEAVQPPLIAAAYRNEQAAYLLLERGASVRARDFMGKTPLHAACDGINVRVDRSDLAARFIAKGADVNAVAENAGGVTPLHLAAGSFPKCVRVLIAARATVDAPDRIGRTPLAWAASNNNAETARLLLDAGADPNREDKDGGSPYAAAYDKPEVRALLETRGGRLTLSQMAKRAYIEGVVKPAYGIKP